jgi:hypothetical protein
MFRRPRPMGGPPARPPGQLAGRRGGRPFRAARNRHPDAETREEVRGMRQAEIAAVQAYLRRLFENPRIALVPPTGRGGRVEVDTGQSSSG